MRSRRLNAAIAAKSVASGDKEKAFRLQPSAFNQKTDRRPHARARPPETSAIGGNDEGALRPEELEIGEETCCASVERWYGRLARRHTDQQRKQRRWCNDRNLHALNFITETINQHGKDCNDRPRRALDSRTT